MRWLLPLLALMALPAQAGDPTEADPVAAHFHNFAWHNTQLSALIPSETTADTTLRFRIWKSGGSRHWIDIRLRNRDIQPNDPLLPPPIDTGSQGYPRIASFLLANGERITRSIELENISRTGINFTASLINNENEAQASFTVPWQTRQTVSKDGLNVEVEVFLGDPPSNGI